VSFPYTLPIVFLETATSLDVAGTIINDAAVEMGLSSSSDPFASSDPNFIQLKTFLKSLGQDLWRRHTWPALTKVYTFTTDAGDGSYGLPEDFGYFINDTAWNRSTRLPVYPLTNRQWQAIKGTSTQTTYTQFFRIRQHQLETLPDTEMPAGQTWAFEYVSRFWVQEMSGTAPTKTAPTRSDDIPWFDPLVLVRGLKWYWLDAKGLPTAASAKERFDETLYLVMGDDAVAPTINTTGRRAVHLIDAANLPDSGHGV